MKNSSQHGTAQQQIKHYQEEIKFAQGRVEFSQEQIKFSQERVSYYQQQAETSQQRIQEIQLHMQMLQEQNLQQELATYSDVYLKVVKFYMFFANRAEYQNAQTIISYLKEASRMVSPTLYQPYMLQELPNYIDRIRCAYDLENNAELALFYEYTTLLEQIQSAISLHEDEPEVQQYTSAMYVLLRAFCDFTNENEQFPEDVLQAIREFREQNEFQVLEQQIQQSESQHIPLEPQLQLQMLQQLIVDVQQEIAEHQQEIPKHQQRISQYQQRASQYQQEISEYQQLLFEYQEELALLQQDDDEDEQLAVQHEDEQFAAQHDGEDEQLAAQHDNKNEQLAVQCSFELNDNDVSQQYNNTHDEF
ncbi:hypothetical protein [Candidatus Fokinia crypta]|uniref:Uncharacterized protein n=1 Tax=Candidatus Fokinia crypta TaxID=1920990 RepID=A0ABZ0UPT8_9RICK|nr:hypothetical protein [Candidatus Fokinia cryptica]WPX98121.1 hypothetical protein Fokcrypt_00655 [Candidatus Fokinia cryptica]